MLDDALPETPLDPRARAADGLVSWIMDRIVPWKNYRDQNHKEKWDEYYAIWRALYRPNSKARASERSQLVTPATMSAVDSHVSEIDEAIFGREQWFEMDEDLQESKDPKQKAEILNARDLLKERTDMDRIPAAVHEAITLGTVFGTGIGKICVLEKEEAYIETDENGLPELKERKRLAVELVPIEPYEFIPDPTTNVIDEMLGMGHETVMPLHIVRELQEDGVYFRDVYIDALSQPQEGTEESAAVPAKDSVKILEWHGKVPAKYLLPFTLENYSDSDEEMFSEDGSLVEAIVTIANDGILIGAKKNPFWNEDRAFIAYQHDTVPKYFWGRGVPEKASGAQKTLDGIVRARQDSLALTASPMLRGDVTRIPKGTNLGIWPGKFWPTTGAPGDVIDAFNLGQVSPDLFSCAADAERMIQVATGAMDPSNYETGEGATQSAIAHAPFLKRAKRTMRNIERNFIAPLIKKIYWRYVQFEPTSFPKDYKIRTTGAMGIMARELESAQMSQLLAMVPNETPPFYAILKGIFDNSSNSHKTEIVQAIDAFLNPPEETPEQAAARQRQEELAMRAQEAEVAKIESEAEKARADATFAQARAQKTVVEADYIDDQLANEAMGRAIDLREVAAFEAQNNISALMARIRAVETAIKAMVAKAEVKAIEADAESIMREGVGGSSKE